MKYLFFLLVLSPVVCFADQVLDSASKNEHSAIMNNSSPDPGELFIRNEKVFDKREVEFNLSSINRDRSAPLLGPDKARMIMSSIDFRNNFTENISGFIKLPFVVSWRETSKDIDITEINQKSGIGDIVLGGSHQIIDENFNLPALMFSLSVKSDTGGEPSNIDEKKEPLGTGYWDVTSGLSLVKTVDPVIFFGSINYTYIFSEIIDTPIGVDSTSDKVESTLGNSFNLLLGLGFSMNDKTELSLKVSGSYVGRQEIDGKEIGSTQAPFYFHSSVDYMIKDNMYIEPSVVFGVTPDAQDFIILSSLIYRF